MGTEAAEHAESATATQTEGQEQQSTEVQAAEGAESATATGGEAEGADPSKTTEGEGSDPTKEAGVLGKKGVDELKSTRKRAQTAEQEAAYWRGRAEALADQGKGGGTAQHQEEIPPTRPKPVATDYDDNSAFVEALTDWKLEQKEAKAAREAEARTESGRVSSIIKAGITKYEDFEAKVLQNPNLPITRDMKAAIDESEQAHEILYHLGSNTQEAARISALSPARQAVEIGKLEVKLAGKPAPAAPAKKPAAPPATLDKGTATGGFDIKKVTIKDQAAMMGLKDD